MLPSIFHFERHSPRAADEVGIELTASERAIIDSVPQSQLMAMAERVPKPPVRREFLQQAGASAVVALGGAALASCERCTPAGPTATAGVQPDIPPEAPPQDQSRTKTLGSRPDLPAEGSTNQIPPPEPRPRPDEPPPPTGITPDLPPGWDTED